MKTVSGGLSHPEKKLFVTFSCHCDSNHLPLQLPSNFILLRLFLHLLLLFLWFFPTVPTQVTVTSSDTKANSTVSQVNAAWTTAVNGLILKYEVQYVTNASSKPSWCKSNQTVSVTATVTSDSVCPRKTYNIRVRAFTSKGPGLWSDPKIQIANARGELTKNSHLSGQPSITWILCIFVDSLQAYWKYLP